MKELEPTISKNGFTYKQSARSKRAGIYTQHEADGEIVAFEVFKIRNQPEKKVVFSGRAVTLEAKELFPGNEEFGKTAWTFKKFEDAFTKFEELNQLPVKETK